MEWGVIIASVMTAFFGVVGYLLIKKDATQEASIVDLYKKHEDDSRKLATLEVKIAENHYPKGELDRMFDRLTTTINQRFDQLQTRLSERRRSDD